MKNASTYIFVRYYIKGKYKMIKNYIEKANFEGVMPSTFLNT